MFEEADTSLEEEGIILGEVDIDLVEVGTAVEEAIVNIVELIKPCISPLCLLAGSLRSIEAEEAAGHKH